MSDTRQTRRCEQCGYVVSLNAGSANVHPADAALAAHMMEAHAPLTQEGLLDLISAHADAHTATVLAVRDGGGAAEDEARSSLWLQVIRAVRSLPIEAGR